MKNLYQGPGHIGIFTKDIAQSIAFYEKIGGTLLKRDCAHPPEGDKPLALGTLENEDKNNGVFYGTKIKVLALPDRATHIGAYACYNQKSLTTLTMGPNSKLTEIGAYAFAHQSQTSKGSLKNLTLSPSLRIVRNSAFWASGLTGTVTIPNSVELLEQMSFRHNNIKEIYFAPGGSAPLTFQGGYLFGNNTTMTKVTLPARLATAYEVTTWEGISVKNFSGHFALCNALMTLEIEEGGELFTVIDGVIYECNEDGVADTLLFCPPARTGDFTVPKEVRKVENGAFANTNLTSISFEEYSPEHENYGKPLLEIGGLGDDETLPSMAETGYAVISPYSTSSGGLRPLAGIGGGSTASAKLKTINFPSHLKHIGGGALRNLSAAGTAINFNMDATLDRIDASGISNSVGIVTLNLPAVKSFGVGAFANNSSLTAINFHPNSSFTVLPDDAFKACTKLASIDIPDHVTAIGNNAFYDCAALKEVRFSNNSELQLIGQEAFYKTGLTTFVMPDGVTSVGDLAFYHCDSLKTVTLSKSLSAISARIFYDDDALEAIHVPNDNIYLRSVDGVLYDQALTIMYCYPAGRDATGFELPDTLQTIEHYAMRHFPGQVLELPETMYNIGGYAFQGAKLTAIHIPANVTSIGNYAFASCTAMASLTFAENSKLASTGSYCFQSCSMLTEVSLPDNLETMLTYTFALCTGLKKVTLPAALKSLPAGTFSGCSNLESVTLQEGLMDIGKNAFASSATNANRGIKSLVIPSTVTAIAERGFEYMYGLETVSFAEGTGLQSITLPASLKTMGTVKSSWTLSTGTYNYTISGLFQNCYSLKYLDMSACEFITTIPTKTLSGCTSIETLLLPCNLEVIEDYAFGDALGIISKFAEPMRNLKQIVIPASVKSIGAYAFYGCEKLESITFEKGSVMTHLGQTHLLEDIYTPTASGKEWYDLKNGFTDAYIFANTPALKTVVLPENLTVIGLNVFENSGVAKMDMPATVATIADYAFKNCDGLTELEFSTDLIFLGKECFYDCNNLAKADIPMSLEALGSLAFAYCQKLTTAFIPAGILGLDGNPFAGCTGITSFTLDPDNRDLVEKDGVLYDKTMYSVLYYPAYLTAETFVLPDSVQEIGTGAMAGAQIKNLVVPNRITKIKDHAFAASGLESITFHNAITAIGDYAFYGCYNLNNVTIPNNVVTLGNYAFANCTSLNNFVFENKLDGQSPYVIGIHFFDGCAAMTEVILPNKMTLSSADLDAWTFINDKTNPACIPGYMFANTGIVHAVIPERITDLITPGVFYGCKQLQSVTFEAKTLKGRAIGQRFFYGCSSLKEIEIPSGLSSIFLVGSGIVYINETFAECTALEKVILHTSTSTTLDTGYGTFKNCKNLTTIEITNASNKPAYFNSINADAFYGCEKLKEIPFTTSSQLTFYGSAFAGSGFETLHFNTTKLVISGAIPFAGMTNLKQIFMKFGAYSGMNAETFTGIGSEVNVYFYNHTKEQIVKMAGNDAWFTEADEGVTFYFKDTMPDDVKVPGAEEDDDDDSGSGSGGGGGMIPFPGIRV